MNRIGDEGARLLAAALEKNQSLSSIDLKCESVSYFSRRVTCNFSSGVAEIIRQRHWLRRSKSVGGCVQVEQVAAQYRYGRLEGIHCIIIVVVAFAGLVDSKKF